MNAVEKIDFFNENLIMRPKKIHFFLLCSNLFHLMKLRWLEAISDLVRLMLLIQVPLPYTK